MSELSLFDEHSNLIVAFSESKDGSMRFGKSFSGKNDRNRRNFFEKVGINPERVVAAQLVHGNQVEVVNQGDAGNVFPGADALLTRESNLFLAATFADCLPIFVYCPDKKVVGLVHGGWRGLSENILENTVRKLKDKFKVRSDKIEAGIGPGICKEHFEVGEEVRRQFENFPEAYQRKGEKGLLDLKKIVRSQLVNLGVEEDNIETSSECTYEQDQKYFSYRRSGGEPFKTMIGVVGKTT